MERGRMQGRRKFFGVPRIISGTGKTMNFEFGRYIHRVIRTKAHEKFGRKVSVVVSRDCRNFWSTLYYPRIGQSYELQFLYAHPQYRSEQKPITNFGKSSRGRSQDSRNFSSMHSETKQSGNVAATFPVISRNSQKLLNYMLFSEKKYRSSLAQCTDEILTCQLKKCFYNFTTSSLIM